MGSFGLVDSRPESLLRSTSLRFCLVCPGSLERWKSLVVSKAALKCFLTTIPALPPAIRSRLLPAHSVFYPSTQFLRRGPLFPPLSFIYARLAPLGPFPAGNFRLDESPVPTIRQIQFPPIPGYGGPIVRLTLVRSWPSSIAGNWPCGGRETSFPPLRLVSPRLFPASTLRLTLHSRSRGKTVWSLLPESLPREIELDLWWLLLTDSTGGRPRRRSETGRSAVRDLREKRWYR